MDLASAIQKHAEWKTKFRSAINKKETMDAATIGKDNCCELGKWLHGEGKAKVGQAPSYPELVRSHAAFHVQAGKIAGAINAKRFAEAEAMLANGTPYAESSSAVGVAIMRLKKDASL